MRYLLPARQSCLYPFLYEWCHVTCSHRQQFLWFINVIVTKMLTTTLEVQFQTHRGQWNIHFHYPRNWEPNENINSLTAHLRGAWSGVSYSGAQAEVRGLHQASCLGCSVNSVKKFAVTLYLKPSLAGVPQGTEVRSTETSWSDAFPANFAVGDFTFTSLRSSQFQSQLGKYWNGLFQPGQLPETELRQFWEMNVCSLHPLLTKTQIPRYRLF